MIVTSEIIETNRFSVGWWKKSFKMKKRQPVRFFCQIKIQHNYLNFRVLILVSFLLNFNLKVGVLGLWEVEWKLIQVPEKSKKQKFTQNLFTQI